MFRRSAPRRTNREVPLDPAVLLRMGPALVGGVLLVSVFLKVVGNGRFARHLLALGVPVRAVQPALQAFVALESALGAALVVGLWPAILWPVAALQLVVLSAVTLRAFAQGRIQDCGCYSGLLTLTPRQSAALNAVYVTPLAAAW